eukprot:COSAG01_NODE_4909_length_4634_cov_25.764498_3_plen_86_part_00
MAAKPSPFAVENFLRLSNPYHTTDEVTTSDYVTLLVLGLGVPLFVLWLQRFVDAAARGRPIAADDPRYFTAPPPAARRPALKKQQ